MTTHSVLGGESQTYDSAAIHRALLFSGPVEIATRFTNVCLITFAFVVTAKLTWMILEDQTPNAGQAASVSLREWRRILWFCVKFCVCMFASLSLEFLTTTQPVMDLCERLHINIRYLSWGLGLVALIAVAWVIAPVAVRLLPPSGNMEISPIQKTMARKMGMLAAATSTILDFLYDTFRHNIKVDSDFEGGAVGMVASIVTNAPLLLLFIGLAVLSLNGLEMQEPLPDTPATEGDVAT